jgi:hypothetical protein
MKKPLPQPPAHLVDAMNKCREILEQNDIAGVILLHAEQAEGPGTMLMTYKIDTTYSCVEFNGKTLYVKQMPDTRRVPGTDPVQFEQRQVTVIKTVNMLANVRLRLEEMFKFFMSAEFLVRSKFNIAPKSASNGQNKQG